jgi:hypothetical protein
MNINISKKQPVERPFSTIPISEVFKYNNCFYIRTYISQGHNEFTTFKNNVIELTTGSVGWIDDNSSVFPVDATLYVKE